MVTGTPARTTCRTSEWVTRPSGESDNALVSILDLRTPGLRVCQRQRLQRAGTAERTLTAKAASAATGIRATTAPATAAIAKIRPKHGNTATATGSAITNLPAESAAATAASAAIAVGAKMINPLMRVGREG